MSDKLTRDEVIRVLGRVNDAKIAAIIASGASLRELEQAAAWALGESDILGKLPDHASPAMARVYDILTAEEKLAEDYD